MIEITNLHKSFGKFHAVDGLSFTIPNGQVLGFLGPNGAGKTTTMRMLAGFLKPDSGSIRIHGEDMVANPIAAQRLLGYLPEGAPSYRDMSVRAFLDFVSSARGLRSRRRAAAIDRVVALLRLEEVLWRPIETLSKGFQRRVGLAQALIHDPDVLILDEPTDGLDPNQKHQVRQLIRQLASQKIVVVSTHILEEVDAVCGRAIIINRGRLVADAEPAHLKTTSEYYQAVELELREEQMEQAGDLIHLQGVREVVRGGESESRLMVLPKAGCSILEGVQQHLRARGVEPVSISLSSGRLDDVFRRITADESGEAGIQ